MCASRTQVRAPSESEMKTVPTSCPPSPSGPASPVTPTPISAPVMARTRSAYDSAAIARFARENFSPAAIVRELEKIYGEIVPIT